MWDVLARSATGGKPWTVAAGLPRVEAEQVAETEAAREESVVTLSRSITKATSDDASGEFIPGSVTDTCGVCFKPFDLQRPADQHKTVRNWGTDTWDLICPDCDEAIAKVA